MRDLRHFARERYEFVQRFLRLHRPDPSSVGDGLNTENGIDLHTTSEDARLYRERRRRAGSRARVANLI